MLCRCQKCLFPLCKVVQLEKLVFSSCTLAGEIRSLSLFPCNFHGRKSTYYSGEKQRWFIRPKGNEERSLQSADRLLSKTGPAKMMLSSYCGYSTSLSPKSTPSPREESAMARLVTKEELFRSPPGPEQGSPTCLSLLGVAI